ncbi:hypothetical protein TNCV_4413121 [Trichonephila clavipes]|nr:hypothetical protein TNCV_4413121 [Trichonephila clavipes]
MVQHKKGTAAKRAQARKDKKAFDVNTGNDSDFDGNSEEMVVQETPQGRKSQMARSMSAKNVSREVSGKKTPGKTPLKNNSFIGKSAAQEVKGRKNKKPQIEEMDDEEENDDFESDMNDDEVEEQEQIQKQKSFSKQQKKDVKTPVKGAEESKKPQTPKAKTPKNQIQEKDSSEGDDSDEDGDSDEDEDDDSDDDNEQEQIPKQKSNSKRQRNGETPMECADKSEPQMPETKVKKN